MTPSERQLLEAISRRAAQMQRLADGFLKNDLPVMSVMALVSFNLMRTLVLFCGEALQKEFLSWMVASLRTDAGLCDLCGAVKAKPTDIACGACLKHMDTVDREIDIDVAWHEKDAGKTQ